MRVSGVEDGAPGRLIFRTKGPRTNQKLATVECLSPKATTAPPTPRVQPAAFAQARTLGTRGSNGRRGTVGARADGESTTLGLASGPRAILFPTRNRTRVRCTVT